jgi:DNA repair exonuclease SbcCD ATPase subunit
MSKQSSQRDALEELEDIYDNLMAAQEALENESPDYGWALSEMEAAGGAITSLIERLKQAEGEEE